MPTNKSTAEATAGASASEVAELPRIDEAIVVVERLYQAITGGPPPAAAAEEPYMPIPVEKDAAEFVTERLDRLIDAIDSISALGPPFAAGKPAAGPHQQAFQGEQGQRDRQTQAGAPAAGAAAQPAWSPPLTLWEDREGLLIHLEMPGVQRQDLQLTHDGDSLTVAGKRMADHGDQAGNGDRRLRMTERPLGPFWRRIILPRGSGGGEVNARLRDGLLEVRVPKPKGGAAAPRNVPIS